MKEKQYKYIGRKISVDRNKMTGKIIYGKKVYPFGTDPAREYYLVIINKKVYTVFKDSITSNNIVTLKVIQTGLKEGYWGYLT